MSVWKMAKPEVTGPIDRPTATIRFGSESDQHDLAPMNRRGERVLKLAARRDRDVEAVVAEFADLPEVRALVANRGILEALAADLARVEATATVARKNADARRRQLLELGKASAEHLAEMFDCTRQAVDRAERDANAAEGKVDAARRAVANAEAAVFKLHVAAEVAAQAAARREEDGWQRDLIREQIELEDEIRRTLDPLMRRYVDLHFARQVQHPDGIARRKEIVARAVGPTPALPRVVPDAPHPPPSEPAEPAPRKSLIERAKDAIFAGAE